MKNNANLFNFCWVFIGFLSVLCLLMLSYVVHILFFVYVKTYEGWGGGVFAVLQDIIENLRQVTLHL